MPENRVLKYNRDSLEYERYLKTLQFLQVAYPFIRDPILMDGLTRQSMQLEDQQMEKSKSKLANAGAVASSTKTTLPPKSSPMVARDHLMENPLRQYDSFYAPGVASSSKKNNDQSTRFEASSTRPNGLNGMMASCSYLQFSPPALF